MTGAGRAIVVKPGDGAGFRLGKDRFRRKGPVRADDPFAIIEYEGAAGVPGPPPHLHRAFDEGWYVLQGTVEFWVAGRVTRGGVGSYVLIPRGVPHGFQVVGDEPARWVGIFAPGKYVGLLQELSRILPAAGPPDPAKLGKLFRKYDTEIVRRNPP